MAEGETFVNEEPIDADKIQLSVDDVRLVLGRIVKRKDSVLTDPEQDRLIALWLREHKSQFLHMLDATEDEVIQEGEAIAIMVQRTIRKRVVVAYLQFLDTNRKTVGLSSYRVAMGEHRNELEDLEMYLSEFFHPSVRGRGDSASRSQSKGQKDRAERGEEGEQDKLSGFYRDNPFSGDPDAFVPDDSSVGP